MSWTGLLEREMAFAYGGTMKLLDFVDDGDLNWKPATGENWMNVGQLLMHISAACGAAVRGFVTGDWGMPDGMDVENMSPEEMLPPAEKLPTVSSVAEAKQLLEDDKKVAFDMLSRSDENTLTNQDALAPWDPTPFKLGHRILQMVQHLYSHRHQLFYYLKLQGKPVDTGHLWGT